MSVPEMEDLTSNLSQNAKNGWRVNRDGFGCDGQIVDNKTEDNKKRYF
ncbi:hypothetical protein [Sinorhizobium fredii]